MALSAVSVLSICATAVVYVRRSTIVTHFVDAALNVKHFHHLQKAPLFQMVFARQFKQKLCETREGLVLRSLTLVILSVSWIHLQKLYRGRLLLGLFVTQSIASYPGLSAGFSDFGLQARE